MTSRNNPKRSRRVDGKGCEVLDGKLIHEEWDKNDMKILLIVMIPTICLNGGSV